MKRACDENGGLTVFKRLMTILILGMALAASPGIHAPGAYTTAMAQAALSPDDSAAVRRALRYLNSLTTVRARFIQAASNGAYAEGEVTVARPGKLRFEYDPPSPALLIANGLTLLFYDRELKQASFLPLWETPLWFLIREDVKLTDNIQVRNVEQSPGALRITLEDDEMPDAGQVTLVFSDKPLSLKKWEITDPQGISTQVSLINPLFGVEVDPMIFDYSDLEIESGVRKPEGN